MYELLTNGNIIVNSTDALWGVITKNVADDFQKNIIPLDRDVSIDAGDNYLIGDQTTTASYTATDHHRHISNTLNGSNKLWNVNIF